MFFVSTTI